jgi:ABC-2 type transport system permease protein
VVSPVLTTSLYFVVFGAAIGSRIEEVEGVSYGAFIVPGLIMLTVLTAGDLQRVLRHLFSRNSSARSTSFCRHRCRSSRSPRAMSGGGDQGADDRADHPGDVVLLRRPQIAHPVWMVAFLVLTCLSFALFGLHHRHLGAEFRAVAAGAAAGDHAAGVPRRRVLLDLDAAAVLADGDLFNPVVYLISGFRWSFFGLADVPVGWSLVAIGVFLRACLAAVAWIFRSGWRLRP